MAEEEPLDAADEREEPLDADEAEGAPDEDAAYEEVEVDFSEDEIEAYLVDEDGNEIGFTVLDEDGNEVEYYYVEDEGSSERPEAAGDAAGASPDEDNPYDMGITREGVANATREMNDIYHDGAAIAGELKGAFEDIAQALDFSDILGKKKK